MIADKTATNLEKQLKTLGKKIRIDILKSLKNSENLLSYSTLQHRILDGANNSTNLSFHLNALKECNLIESSEDGYSITIIGSEILKNILSMEQFLNNQRRVLMVRTSKYSKEPFNPEKIEEYLSSEGNLESYLAKKIATEVHERLSKTNIDYLTAPLIREYVNAVLLENNLEEIRHKLTRLGCPPSDVENHLEQADVQYYTTLLKMGKEVSEQFHLLNLLPKKLADLYLSGEVILLNLGTWTIAPLSVHINSSSFLGDNIELNKNLCLKTLSNYSIHERGKNLLQFFNTLGNFCSIFSGNITLNGFSDYLSAIFTNSSINKPNILLYILESQLLNNLERNSYSPSLSLDLRFSTDSNLLKITQITERINNYTQSDKISYNFGYYSLSQIESIEQISNILNASRGRSRFKFYNENRIYTPDSFLTAPFKKYEKDRENFIVMDKILVNMHPLALNAKGNDNIFKDLMEDKIFQVIDLFNLKTKYLRKFLSKNIMWQNIASNYFKSDCIKNSIKVISFCGLNKAISQHCGIELDRTKKSEEFALSLIKHMLSIIKEQNEDLDENYVLGQPHIGSYLQEARKDEFDTTEDPNVSYCSRIIRKESSLSLENKIKIYKKFQKYLSGGSAFQVDLNKTNASISKNLEKLIKNQINFFYFN